MIVFDTTNQIYGQKLTANENQAIADYFCCHGDWRARRSRSTLLDPGGLRLHTRAFKKIVPFSFKSPDKMCTL